VTGYEARAMIRKEQIPDTSRHDMQAQTALIAGLFNFVA
jgi:hypothetical protein